MSHYTLTVALPGDIPAEELRDALNVAMDEFNEQRDVPLHRDLSPYAETFADQLAKAKAYGKECEANGKGDHTAGKTDAEIVEDWSGGEGFDNDGWPLTTRNPDGHWDWWVIGGRWGGAWYLRGEDGPLNTDDHAFGREDRADEPNRTDNARWRDIEPESVTPTYAWLDLNEEWHTKWIGPTREEATGTIDYKNTAHWQVPEDEHVAGFMKFLANLPGDAWLVHIDFHN